MSTKVIFQGFKSAGFCKELSDVLSREAINQYGINREALDAYRVKSSQLDPFFDDAKSKKRWSWEKRKQGEFILSLMERVGVQGRLSL